MRRLLLAGVLAAWNPQFTHKQLKAAGWQFAILTAVRYAGLGLDVMMQLLIIQKRQLLLSGGPT